MNIGQVRTIVMIGAGIMDQQIAMNTALNGRTNGYQVILCDSFLGTVGKTQKWATDYLSGYMTEDRIMQSEANRISASLSFSQDADKAAARADIIAEATIEDLEIKRKPFRRVSKLCRPDTILGTNSPNLVNSKLADVTQSPQRLLSIHHFSPVLMMQLVELVRDPRTTPEAIETVKAFTVNTGRAPVVINKEISGFVANYINTAIAHETYSLLKKDIASVEDIDVACEKGLGYSMGPSRPMGLTGIDVNYYACRDRYAESDDEYDKPSPLVAEKFRKGEFG